MKKRNMLTALMIAGMVMSPSVVRADEGEAIYIENGAVSLSENTMAEGETIVKNRHFIERGYEDICRDYQNLGVNIYTG